MHALADDTSESGGQAESAASLHMRTLVRHLLVPIAANTQADVTQAIGQAARSKQHVVLLDMLVSPYAVSITPIDDAILRLRKRAKGENAAPDVIQHLEKRRAAAAGAAAARTTSVRSEDESHMPAVVLYKSRPVWCPCALPLAALLSKR